ncbi:hypothetical protein G7Y89_g4449 [Cudoniella acicularis]|uniref:LIM zinc-binding domain-containing protein n=1 Tax=Cudoniella acicularis TaxID=354080 RepID=A0A8H4RQ89_9HELO|nr:hypothetical protein G7Y89_g4449 [Cudoniella acicularis]
MADSSRPMSFLPTIKCSICSVDIAIAEMANHFCGSGSGEPTPPPDSNGSFDRMSYKQNPTNGPGFLKPARGMPPRVDTSAANRPYFPQDQLTPVSPSTSTSVSPSDGRRSPFGRPLRSVTAPLSSNLDCAFPPFPTKSGKNKPQQSLGAFDRMGDFSPEIDPMYAPVSPRTASSGGLLQRMNTIAPGPFDVNRRRNAEGSSTTRGHQRKGTEGSLKDITISPEREDIGGLITRPSTAGPGHSRSSTNSSNGSRSGFMPPRVPRNNGYGGFGPLIDGDDYQEPLRAENRSQTFPLRSESQDPPFRRPSELRAGPQLRMPSNDSGNRFNGSRNPSISGPDLSRPLPPRGTSLIRPRLDTKASEAPAVPDKLNLAEEFGIGNPYHTPTESQSSDTSGFSEESKASSRSSPPRSNASGRSRRQPSNTSPMNVLMSDLESSMADLKPKELPFNSSPTLKEQYPRPLAPPQTLKDPMLSPESPMDPAIQGGRLSPLPARNFTRPDGPRPKTPQERHSRRPTSSKGNCKGCSEPIKGKSISSADGRLTGRYHKQCFVCKTCSEPFQTSTFYVIDDAPYCERHYHKLNGSVCTTCDKGIEGQYLESERKQKFHPGCLTCADCKRTLRNDYFEMNGRVYCERDAFRRAQQTRFLGPGGGGSNRMERRTTRMMMM